MPKDGYAWADGHPQRRAALIKQLERDGFLTCWRCGDPIYTADNTHLGHDDFDRSITRGAEHKACNLRAAGLKVHGLLNPAKASRNWW
jgi:hypothetical protein